MPDILAPEARSSNLKLATGQHTTVADADTIATGLQHVLYAVAQLQSAPVIGADRVLADVGTQVSAPVAGSIIIRTYKPTSTTNTTPVVATTFSLVVNWIAVGY